jgi:NhaA family Na+:H+ antiporter
MQFYAVSVLTGIGFTMSLFIGLLAFPTAPSEQDADLDGVLFGSIVSGLAGYILFSVLPKGTTTDVPRSN